jgi:uncharacterized membrane protein
MDIILNCETIEGGQTCTLPSSEPYFTPFFSAGDIVISIFLLILIIFELIKFLSKGLSTQKVVRNYQGNNSPDGKEFYKI